MMIVLCKCHLGGTLMFKKILVSLFVFLGGSCLAHNNYTDSTELPEKQGVHHIKTLINVLNSGVAEQAESFIKNNFTEKFLNMSELSQHKEIFLTQHEEQGDLTFYSVRSYDKPRKETEFVVILKSTKTGFWRAITFYISSVKPYKIDGLQFSSARAPRNLPKRASLSMKEAMAEFGKFVERMAKLDIFSGSVLLTKGDKVLYKATYGMASKRFNAPNNLQTKFNLGSMNKMFTSVAIMQLVEKGKLSLNDKLSKYVDESWFAKDVSNKIEIRHLLTHSSGLGSHFNKKFMETSKNLYRNLDDYKPLIKDEKLNFEPGTDNQYSNTGMFMLGVVIEKVSGKDYFNYIRENIYQPANMNNSDSYEMDQPVPNLAIGYEQNKNNLTGWNNNLYLHVLKGGPAGGGFSTVGDLQKFALALTSFELLGEKFTKELYSEKPNLHSTNYGYGFQISGTKSNRIVGHGGGFPGINSNLDIYLDKGYVVAVMSNYSRGAQPITRKIRELLALVD